MAAALSNHEASYTGNTALGKDLEYTYNTVIVKMAFTSFCTLFSA
jgi:hypothetical protein